MLLALSRCLSPTRPDPTDGNTQLSEGKEHSWEKGLGTLIKRLASIISTPTVAFAHVRVAPVVDIIVYQERHID